MIEVSVRVSDGLADYMSRVPELAGWLGVEFMEHVVDRGLGMAAGTWCLMTEVLMPGIIFTFGVMS